MAKELLSEWGRWRASLRKRVEITCEICGKQVNRYAGALVCSAACRQKKKRQRAAARRRPDPAQGETDA